MIATDSEVLGPAPVVSIGDGSGGGDDELGEEYEKVEFSVLYYHKTSGYYYEPVSQFFIIMLLPFMDILLLTAEPAISCSL